ELKRELQKACGTARDRGQDANVEQLAAEAEASILERRVKECEQIAQARKDRCSRARKTARRETTAADSQLANLARRLEKLQRTLDDERASRQSDEFKHHRAKNTTIQLSRYLDSILNVNQELVAAGTPSSLTPTARQSVPRALGELQRKQSIRESYATPRQSSALEGDGIDIRAAVNEAFCVGRTGGDPVPSLTALYERIGFSAIQGENRHHGGTPSLPTSPRRARVGSNAAEAYRFRDVRDGEDYGRQRLVEPTALGGFFAEDDTEVLESSRRQASGHQVDDGGSRPAHGGKHHGTGTAFAGGGVTTKGYSFANSPLVRPTSAAERSPEVVKRLEALASQLEKERSDVEQWYKDVVHRASPCVQEEGTDADLDARGLTEAISCLQKKSQQLDVVRESLKAFKASPPTPAITSPTLCRRKVAALNVLHGLCHDVHAIAGENGGLSAA
ncbi:unnamed protein product, partial [Ectocarpus sp. 4 AP-2014]